MKRASLLVLSALLIVALTPDAFPAVARAINFDQKVESADSIVVGDCIRTHSEFDPSGRWIITYSTFRVTRSLKGFSTGEVTVVTPGGQVGSLRQETIGIPKFGVGDSNVLFVRSSSIGPTVLYFDQGVYRVTSGSDGDTVVRPAESDLVLVDTQTGRARAVSDEPTRSLAQFESDVRKVLERRGGLNR